MSNSIYYAEDFKVSCVRSFASVERVIFAYAITKLVQRSLDFNMLIPQL
jgi:hypothetical protein